MKKMMVLLLAMTLLFTPLFVGCSIVGSDDGDETVTEELQDSDSEDDEEAESGTQSDSSSKISREKAVRIVLDRVDGADESDIHEMDLDHDDGQLVYEGELRYSGYEYDFEIDAETGEIIKWEIDRD